MPKLATPRKIPLLVICGPTASGKTRLALELAATLPIEIISADSRQIYRGMDIGTAKATPEERACVPHHLLDVVAPDEPFSAADFMRLGREAIAEIHQRGKLAVVVGGTGLYLDALTRGLVAAPGEDPLLRQELIGTGSGARGGDAASTLAGGRSRSGRAASNPAISRGSSAPWRSLP